jgi:tryptophanyl-tRNA synthetase
MSKPVILTGLRANNDLTIGNYLGALLPMIDMAKKRAGEYQVNLFVPDLHSFTTPIDHTKLYEQVLHNIKVYIAAGLPIDHEDVYVYRQSQISAHSELTWILDCFTGMGEMGRMTQFKDKAGTQAFTAKLQELFDEAARQGIDARNTLDSLQINEGDYKTAYEGVRDAYRISLKQIESFIDIIVSMEDLKDKESSASVGLFNYPVLMAADILLYDAKYIPVGADQTQHLEFTRDIAERMNNRFADFGELFVVPEAVPNQHEFFGKDQGLKIKDLQDPTKKMSKSDESGKGVIFLSDAPTTALNKIKAATTDTFGEVKYDPKERPGISNLLLINSLFSNTTLDETINKWEGETQYGKLKADTGTLVANFLEDFQYKLADVSDSLVLDKLNYSENRMRSSANETLSKVQRAVGLRYKFMSNFDVVSS